MIQLIHCIWKRKNRLINTVKALIAYHERDHKCGNIVIVVHSPSIKEGGEGGEMMPPELLLCQAFQEAKERTPPPPPPPPPLKRNYSQCYRLNQLCMGGGWWLSLSLFLLGAATYQHTFLKVALSLDHHGTNIIVKSDL